MEYIHLNPVRAGLLKRAEEWQWSSVHDYTGGLSATLRPNRTLAIDRVCCRPMNGDEFEGKAEESLKNETLHYPLRTALSF